jgi:O-antigen ligase
VFSNGNVLWVFPVTAGENAMGPYINKNHFAGYMEMIIPIALSYYLYTAGKIPLPSEELANSRVRQALFFLENKRFSSLTQGMAAVLLLTGALFMTLSRGGILGYAVSMAVFAWLISVRRSLRKRIVFMALLGGIVALAVITAGWRMFETRFEVAVQQGDKRLDAWQDSRSLARDFPVFGTGWGAFGSVFPLYQTRHAALRFEHPENEYIEVLAETGGAGLVLLLAAVAALSWKLVRRWRDRHNTFVVCFGVGGFAAFTAIAVHSLTDFNMRVPANALLMTVIVALTCAALFKVPSRRKNSAEKA